MSKPQRTRAGEIPRAVREELADTLEDIGSAMTLLRESVSDADAGNEQGAKLCGSDALELLGSLEARFSQMAGRLAMWSESAEEGSCECGRCGARMLAVRPGEFQCTQCD